jgi:hypothetical protein
MNKLINPNSFTENFKNASVDKTNGSKSVAKNLVMAMAFCVASAFSYSAEATDIDVPNILSDTNAYSQYNNESDPIREITHENFNEIVNGQISGLYKNPANDNEIMALSFANDPDAHKRISADLDVLFSDEGNYNFSKLLDDNSEFYLKTGEKNNGSVNTSRHIQDPFGMGMDVNYTVLDTENHMLSKETLAANPSWIEYENIYVLKHEAAHGEQRQMGLIGFVESIFDNEELVEIENSADFTAAIMTAQYMNDAGESPDEIIKFLNAISEDRVNELPGEVIHMGEVDHVTSSSIYVAIAMISDNPDKVFNLEYEQVNKISDVVSEMAVNHDYTDDLIGGILLDSEKQKEKDDAVDFLESMKKLSLENPDKYHDILENMKKDAENEPSESKKEGLLAVIDAIETTVSEENPNIDEIANGLILKDFNIDDKVNIDDLEGQQALGKGKVTNYPEFAETVMEKLKDENLWDAGRVAEETGQDIDRIVDLANINNLRDAQEFSAKTGLDIDKVLDLVKEQKSKDNDMDDAFTM